MRRSQATASCGEVYAGSVPEHGTSFVLQLNEATVSHATPAKSAATEVGK